MTLVLALLIHYTRDVLFTRHHFETEAIHDEYDYIVIGGGSAGSVVATRLSEDERKAVLLLEAGAHYDENPIISIPLLWPMSLGTDHDWKYAAEPQNHSLGGGGG